MEINTNEIISISAANQNFSNAIRIADKRGRAVIFKNNKPKYVPLFMWCSILSVLKRDILGQEISTDDIIQILVNDFDDNLSELKKAKKYVKKIYKDTYGEDPYWVS